MAYYGITLRLTDTTVQPLPITFSDVRDGNGDGWYPARIHRAGDYIATNLDGANRVSGTNTLDLAYSSDVALSYTFGTIRKAITLGWVTAQFVFEDAVMAGSNAFTDMGRVDAGWVRWVGDENDNDTITIGNGTVTEVWRAKTAGPGIPATVYDFIRGAGVPATIASFCIAVNASSTLVYAVALGGSVVGLWARALQAVPATHYTLAESTATARTVVSAAAMTGAIAPTMGRMTRGSYTITAADVTSMDPAAANSEICIAATSGATAPTLVSFEVRTSAGVFKSKATIGARLLEFSTQNYGLIVDEAGGGPAVLGAGDVITYLIASAE